MTSISKILNPFYNLLLPPSCFGCNALLSGGEVYLCTRCRHQLPLTGFDFVEENALDVELCHHLSVQKASALLYFSRQGIAQSVIHDLKYRGYEQIGRFLARLVLEYSSIREVAQGADLLAPVPLTPYKQAARGYNQLSTFGLELERALMIPYKEDALIREDLGGTQSRRSKRERWEAGPPRFRANPTSVLKGKRVILMDDIRTTGSTLSSCIRALEKAEVQSIFVLCMAVVGDR